MAFDFIIVSHCLLIFRVFCEVLGELELSETCGTSNLVDSGLSVWGGEASRNSKNPEFRLFWEDLESFYNYWWNKNKNHSHFPKMIPKKYMCSSNIALTLFLKLQVVIFRLTKILDFENPKFRGFLENSQFGDLMSKVPKVEFHITLPSRKRTRKSQIFSLYGGGLPGKRL